MTVRKVGLAPYLVLPVLVLALAFAIVGSARAGSPGDQFEIDGNWPANGALADWATVGPLALADATGVKERIVDPGTALFDTYPYPTKDNQNAPGKADLTGAWIASIVDGDSLYLYLAAQRAASQQGTDPGGNTTAIFALHRDATTLSAGDLVIMMDFVNGGAGFVPTVMQYNGATWEDAGLTASVASASSNPDGASGPGGQTLPANVFVEAGIHLTDAGLLTGGGCLNATQLWIMTGASQSNNASLQDVLDTGAIDLGSSGVPVTNCGDVSVEKVVQGDAPQSTWEIAISPDVDNFTSDILANGDSTTDVQVNPNVPVTISETSVQGLTFTASWQCSDGTSGVGPSFQVTAAEFESIDCTITNVVDALPSITVSKSASSGTVPEGGGNVTYTFEVDNTGGVPVTITDLDDDVFGALAGDADCQVGTQLASGASCDFQQAFPLGAAASGSTHTNTFTATVEDDQKNPTSDDDSETVTYTDVLPTVSVGKSAAPDEVIETGGPVSFTFTVTNTGSVPVEIVTLEDDKLGTLAGDADCQVGTALGVGVSCAFDAAHNIPAGVAGATHVNTFTATVKDSDGNTDTDSAQETVTYTDVVPMVSVLKTASPTAVSQAGGDVLFTYRVENTGAVPATILELSDDQFGVLSGDTGCEVGTVLAAGDSCDFAETFSVPAGAPGGTHVNVFTAKLGDSQQNEETDTDDATVTYTDVPASISLTKTPSQSSVTAPGGDVTFTVVVTNTSEVDTVTITSLVDDVFGDLDGLGTCTLDQVLEPDATYECSFGALVDGSAGDTHQNTITASGSANDNGQTVAAQATASVRVAVAPGGGGPGPDPDPVTPVTSPTPTPTPSPTPTPGPLPLVLGSTAQIEKVLTSSDPAVVGEQVTFRVTLTIAGDSDTSDVLVVDTFEHEFLEFVSSSGSCELVPNYPDESHSSIGCEIGNVSPAEDGAAGTEVFEYDLVFEASKATLPYRTRNEVVAQMDLDGAGPAALTEIGPASAEVEIIEVLGVQLPPTGDGSSVPEERDWMSPALAAVMLVAGLGTLALYRRSRAE